MLITDSSYFNEAFNIIKWSENKPFYPTQMDIALTTKCNLKCKFCFFSSDKNQISESEELSNAELLKTVREGLKLGIKKWYIAGGEPLCREEKLLSVLKVIKENHGYCSFTTNGTLFNELIIKRIIEIGCDEVIFSLDSAEPEIHDFLRGSPGTFDRAVDAIKKFQHIKNVLNKKKPLITIHAIIMNKNYKELDKLILLGHKLGASNVFFTHLFRENDFYDSLKLKKEMNNDFMENVKKAHRISLKFGIKTNLEGYICTVNLNNLEKIDELLNAKSSGNKNNLKKNLLSIPCYEPWYKVSMASNGDVSCCCYFCEKKVKPDNIRQSNLTEIWHGKRLNNIRAGILKGEFPDSCKRCPTTRTIYNENIREYMKRLLYDKSGIKEKSSFSLQLNMMIIKSLLFFDNLIKKSKN